MLFCKYVCSCTLFEQICPYSPLTKICFGPSVPSVVTRLSQHFTSLVRLALYHPSCKQFSVLCCSLSPSIKTLKTSSCLVCQAILLPVWV